MSLRAIHTCTGCVPVDRSIIDAYVGLLNINTNATAAEATRAQNEEEREQQFSADHARAVADHDAVTAATTAATNAASAATNAATAANSAASGASYAATYATEAADAASEAVDEARDAADAAAETASKSPYIGGNGKWFVYDPKDQDYVDTNIKARGDKGDKGDTGAQGPQGIQGERGPAGVTSVEVSVSPSTGTPSGSGSVTNGVLSLSFSGLKGETGPQGATGAQGPQGPQGNTGSSVDYPYELVNNCTTDDATKGLAAAQGKVLKDELSQLGQEVVEDGYAVDYRGIVAELYAIAPIMSGSSYCIKYYNGNLYFRSKGEGETLPSNYWNCSMSISGWTNNVVYELKCTTKNTTLGVNVGDTVGWIVFRDIERFKTLSTSRVGAPLYANKVTNIQYSPIIASTFQDIKDGAVATSKLADSAVTTPKIADASVTFPKINKEVFSSATPADYRGTIAELYISAPIESNQVFKVKCYNNTMYARPAVGESAPSWQAQLSVSSASNGVIYPLACTTAGNGVARGDIVGYVIFKDITTFKATTTSYIGAEVYKDEVSSVLNAPKIYQYLENISSAESKIGIDVPDVINAVVGDTLQLYYPSVFKCVNPFIYDIKVSCDIGAQYPRYFELTPVESNIGTHDIKFTIKSNSGVVLGEKSASVVVKKAVASPSANMNILAVGASTTVGGQWVGEMKKRLTTANGTPTTSGGSTLFTPSGFSFNNISFVGRVQANGVNLEATGGYNYNSYLSTGASNPFAHNGAIDIGAYADTYCNGQIDLVIAHLFNNGIITPYQTDFTNALASMRSFINMFLAEFPSCKFGIMVSPDKDERGGLGTDYGAAESNIWTYAYGMKVANHNLLSALQKYITDNNLSDVVYIINILNEFDNWNNYPQTEKIVNPRSPVKEVFGTNGVHPTDIGYYQIADSATRFFVANFCQ